MIVFILTGIYLIICSYTDIKYKNINILISVIMGLIGLLISICSFCGFNLNRLSFCGFHIGSYISTEHTSIFTLAISLFISLLLLIISLLTKGSIETGDCIMLAVLACFMSPYHIMAILVYGLIFSGITALFLLVVRKYSRKDTLFFAPFLLIGHICYFLLYTL